MIRSSSCTALLRRTAAAARSRQRIVPTVAGESGGSTAAVLFSYRKEPPASVVAVRCCCCCRRELGSTSSTIGSSSNDYCCYYDRYRTFRPSADILKELQRESVATMRNCIDKELYGEAYLQIAAAAARQDAAAGTGAADDETAASILLPGQVDVPPGISVRAASSLSVDGTMVAFVAVVRQQQQDIYVLRVSDGRVRKLDVDDVRRGSTVVSVEFGPRSDADGSHLLLWTVAEVDGSSSSSCGRPCALYGARVRSDDCGDSNSSPTSSSSSSSLLSSVLLHRSDDPKVHVQVGRSRDGTFAILEARSQSSSEVFLVDSGEGGGNVRLVRPRESGTTYHVEVVDRSVFVMASGQGGEERGDSRGTGSGDAPAVLGAEYSLFEASFEQLPLRGLPCDWDSLELISDGSSDSCGFALFDFDCFRDYLALYERSKTDGTPRLRIIDRHSPDVDWVVTLPDSESNVFSLSPASDTDFRSNTARFHLDCPVSLRATYEYNMSTREMKDVSQKPIPSRISDTKEIYDMKRVLVPSKDGALVPLSVIQPKESASWDPDADGQQRDPLRVVLFGYGAYGEPTGLSYNPSLAPLLSRGCAIAFAHTRGGGDLGRSWYLRGRDRDKMRAVEDYIACAEALTNGQILGDGRLIELTAKAFSAGGVIVGAAVNQRPDLFDKAVLTNAFLDVYAAMNNPSLHLTEHEWDEYGNPIEDESARKAIAEYCPVKNAAYRANLPRVLLIGALDDAQVPFWNSVIFGKKLRGEAEESSTVSIYVEAEGGHHLGDNRMRVAALEAAFILGDRGATGHDGV